MCVCRRHGKSSNFTQYCSICWGGLLVCLYPWWADTTVGYMISGGYNVKQKTLIIWGEDDQIISNKLAVVSEFYGYKAYNATDK
ncbi:hypothetical protein ACB098_03G188300 [Castanea mollissima]